jgi:hypothetical protein
VYLLYALETQSDEVEGSDSVKQAAVWMSWDSGITRTLLGLESTFSVSNSDLWY